MNQYLAHKQELQNKINNFPLFSAFNDDQFIKGVNKLNIKDKNELCCIGNNAYMKKSDLGAYCQLFKDYDVQHEKLIKEDISGTGYILAMFEYELANHEYGYTMDVSDTLEALNLTQDEIDNNTALSNGLSLARINVVKDDF